MDFTNPFVGMVPSRKLNREEILRALRIDLAAELDAINLYQAHIDAIDDEQVKAIIAHIRDEEKEHVAEFTEAIRSLDPTQAQEFATEHALAIGGDQPPVLDGGAEATDLTADGTLSSTGATVTTGFTVGSLLGEEQT
ncbi:MAG: demethoxyubiquinone hydroxylase family protein [Chloroflexi bacterium]|nr:demethoxyubiquinone hydroxylase family protein [Chloroflexota bacterium]